MVKRRQGQRDGQNEKDRAQIRRKTLVYNHAGRYRGKFYLSANTYLTKRAFIKHHKQYNLLFTTQIVNNY